MSLGCFILGPLLQSIFTVHHTNIHLNMKLETNIFYFLLQRLTVVILIFYKNNTSIKEHMQMTYKIYP